MIKKLILLIIEIVKTIYYVILTIPRDLKGIIMFRKVENTLDRYERDSETIPKLFYKAYKKNPNKPCIIFENSTWTFEDVENYSNKVAHAFTKKFNLKKGDVCGLFMENKAEYPATWLGLAKNGIIIAFINTNLKANPLVHSIAVANAKVVIYGSELTESVEQVRNELSKTVQFVVQGSAATSKSSDTRMEDLLASAPSTSFVPEQPIKPNDVMIYIYTSGTTGLPKPAVIKQNRFFGAGVAYIHAVGFTEQDVIYDCLPIYHGNGGLIVFSIAFIAGCTVVLRKKFSATNFWKECAQYNCTAMIYVGEVCRYLVNQPESAIDRQHKVRVAIGNGLRKNIWEEFTKRFGVKVIEFYAASEGNCTIMNLTGKIGACGFIPIANAILEKLAINIIKVDDEMNPIRNEKGFCIKCEPGEKGLAIGILGDKPTKEYAGYANNKEASSKKIIDNVFKKGQKAFNSGDMLMRDELGYVYFCDRLGDTYRWRGENVSTVEVENAVSAKLNFIEVVVYGVEIPGQEGKAGMATILKKDVDVKKLFNDLKDVLPTYARPVFIRCVESVDHTGSFRAQKHKLVDVGYDVDKINDNIYYVDWKEQTYLPLTKSVYESIKNMKIKL